MANEHVIKINGRRLDPREAAERLLPNDTLLVCPNCHGRHVQAAAPRLSERLEGEVAEMVPRQQDRFCLDCKYQWCSVLPPNYQAHAFPMQTQIILNPYFQQ